MKEKVKDIMAVVVLYLILIGGVILVNYRIEQTKIEAEASITENR